MGGIQLAAPDNKDSKIYPLSYILLEVHVHFASSAHYGAGCYFDIRKGENLVVVVRCSLLLLCVCCLCGACCMLRCVRFCGVLQLHVFQNVSLSTHVNFDSVIWSDVDLSARLFALTRGRGLAFTFARVPV